MATFMMPAKVELPDAKASMLEFFAEPTKVEAPATNDAKAAGIQKQPMKIELPRKLAGAEAQEPVKVMLPIDALRPPPPGLQAPAAPRTSNVSIGSALHGSGTCRPCAWFWRSGGCQNDKACYHCHLCPEGELKVRKKNKLTMMRLGLATPHGDSGASPSPDDYEPVSSFGISSEPLSFGIRREPGATVGLDPAAPEFIFTSSQESPESTTSTAYPASRQDSQDSASSSEHENGGGDAPETSPIASASATTSDQTAQELELAADHAEAVALSVASSIVDDESVEGAVPLPPPGLALPTSSRGPGSALHLQGLCRPCAWFYKPGGCQNEVDCSYCHLCPEGELKNRKKSKLVLMRMGLVTPKNGVTSSEQDAKYALSLSNCV